MLKRSTEDLESQVLLRLFYKSKCLVGFYHIAEKKNEFVSILRKKKFLDVDKILRFFICMCYVSFRKVVFIFI